MEVPRALPVGLHIEIMEKIAEIYFNWLNSTRAMINNLFKMFGFQTGKSNFVETYYEALRLLPVPLPEKQ